MLFIENLLLSNLEFQWFRCVFWSQFVRISCSFWSRRSIFYSEVLFQGIELFFEFITIKPLNTIKTCLRELSWDSLRLFLLVEIEFENATLLFCWFSSFVDLIGIACIESHAFDSLGIFVFLLGLFFLSNVILKLLLSLLISASNIHHNCILRGYFIIVFRVLVYFNLLHIVLLKFRLFCLVEGLRPHVNTILGIFFCKRESRDRRFILSVVH